MDQEGDLGYRRELPHYSELPDGVKSCPKSMVMVDARLELCHGRHRPSRRSRLGEWVAIVELIIGISDVAGVTVGGYSGVTPELCQRGALSDLTGGRPAMPWQRWCDVELIWRRWVSYGAGLRSRGG